MSPQPIQTSSSADSSPILTPSGTPPSFLGHNLDGKLQHFLAAFEGSSGAIGRGRQADEQAVRRKSESSGAGPSRGPYPEYTPRPVLPFFSGLSLSRPQPAFQSITHLSTGMAKTTSTSGSNDTPASTGRLDPKRAATLPAGVEALCAEKRHYDPSREPKLLHFM